MTNRDAADPYYTIGRVRGLVEMLDEPMWNMTLERLVERLRVILAEHDAAKAEERKERKEREANR
jgi:hypothetical protein